MLTTIRIYKYKHPLQSVFDFFGGEVFVALNFPVTRQCGIKIRQKIQVLKGVVFERGETCAVISPDTTMEKGTPN